MTTHPDSTIALVLAFIAGVAAGVFLLTAWPAVLRTLDYLAATA